MNPVTVAEALRLAIATIERLNRHESANGTLDVLREVLARYAQDQMRCVSCGVPVSLTQALLSQQRRDGAEVACKDCVTKELTTKGDR